MSPDTISVGPGGSSGDAVAMPPAVSSGSGSRDQRMRTPSRVPSPSDAISASAPCAALITRSAKPARASASICQTMSGLCPASSSGFGVASDSVTVLNDPEEMVAKVLPPRVVEEEVPEVVEGEEGEGEGEEGEGPSGEGGEPGTGEAAEDEG